MSKEICQVTLPYKILVEGDGEDFETNIFYADISNVTCDGMPGYLNNPNNPMQNQFAGFVGNRITIKSGYLLNDGRKIFAGQIFIYGGCATRQIKAPAWWTRPSHHFASGVEDVEKKRGKVDLLKMPLATPELSDK